MSQESKFKLTVYISKDNAKKLGYEAVDRGKPKSDVMDEILTKHFQAKKA